MAQTGEKHTLAARALACIRRDYALLDGVEMLADLLGVTPAHLIRTVRGAAGQSPGKLLQKRRLEVAAALLRGRSYPVETVARMTGFSCGNYFSKVFARAYGTAPLAYRGARPAALSPEEEQWVRALESMYHI